MPCLDRINWQNAYHTLVLKLAWRQLVELETSEIVANDGTSLKSLA